MEYIAENYIEFIEQGRKDKLSPIGLSLIATKFRELERQSKHTADIPDWIIKYDKANYQSSAGRAIRELIKIITPSEGKKQIIFPASGKRSK